MWVHSHSLYCNSIKKSMTNIILPLTILCNYGNGKYKLPMYCLYIILHTGIMGLIIFLKPGLEPRLWAFSNGKPSPSPVQARQWAGLGRAQMGQAWVGFGLWAQPSTSLGGFGQSVRSGAKDTFFRCCPFCPIGKSGWLLPIRPFGGKGHFLFI